MLARAGVGRARAGPTKGPRAARAVEREREAALFGEPEPQESDEEGSQDEPEEAPAEADAAFTPPAGGQSARDETIFGPTDADELEESDQRDATRDDAIFATEPGEAAAPEGAAASIAAQLAEAEDELALGGIFVHAAQLQRPRGQRARGSVAERANLVDLYLDARPNDRVRAYMRGRLLYDYSIPQQAGSAQPLGGAEDEDASPQTLPLGLVGGGGGLGTRRQLDAQLDQLWVKFDIARAVYLTVGRQRIRWGAGQFWNPTDFLNANQINPLAIFDQRLGVDLVKVHVPVETLGWNFYAIASLGQADTLEDVGGALRGEFLFGATELTVSAAVRQQTAPGPSPIEAPEPLDIVLYEPELDWPRQTVPVRLGSDVSSALGPFDVRLEGALTRGLGRAFYRGDFDIRDLTALTFPEDYSREDEWIPQGVAGADIALEYGDGDALIVGGEYFYNGAGYDGAELYLWLALQGGLRPLYLGRHYAALAVVAPSPGKWNDTSFTLSTVGNLSDRSFLSRLDYSVQVLTDLRLNAFVNVHYGRVGEFRFRVEVPPVPGQTTEPTVIPGPLVSLGGALRMSF